MKRLRLGSRGSQLALFQARLVAERIHAAGGPASDIVVTDYLPEGVDYINDPTDDCFRDTMDGTIVCTVVGSTAPGARKLT